MEGGPRYNAAADLIERNLGAGRAGKTAFIDDRGRCSYAELGERALRCLEAELRYRERVLREAGVDDLRGYLRAPAATRTPLPRLVVVIDEFATMAAELPEFMEALVGVAQRGRSLGDYAKSDISLPELTRLMAGGAELEQLVRTERPRLVETVAWAAGNGDRSENGDYIYGKKRLREIDRRIRFLIKRIESADVVDPERQQELDQVFFGATVTIEDVETAEQQTWQIVGVDEADASDGRISWISPLARALLKAKEGDAVRFQSPAGMREVEIVAIRYV